MREIISFCKDHGADIESVELDGLFHSLTTESFKGWYIGDQKEFKGKTLVTFTLGDWKTGERHVFKEEQETLTREERKELARASTLILRREREEKEKVFEATAAKCAQTFDSIKGEYVSPYLVRKKIKKLYGAKTSKNSFGKIDLVIPMKDTTGKLWGYQVIEEDGSKQFQFQQKMEGLYFQFGSFHPNSEVIFICEGYATGNTIFEATQHPTLCALSSSNMAHVARAIRKLLPTTPIVIAGDDDTKNPTNTGRLKAIEAVRECRGTAVFPEFDEASGEKKCSDFNDLMCHEDIDAVRAQLSAKFPKPEDVIETEHTGFHTVTVSIHGKELRKPNPDDLLKFYSRQHPFVGLAESRLVYAWNGKHYQAVPDARLKEFAELHYSPKPDNKAVAEFSEKIMRTNLKDMSWFSTALDKKVNFQNGVLDLKERKLHPHSPEYGFRNILGFDYDPAAEAPIFKKFLYNVTLGDTEAQTALLEYAGYCLSGDSCWAQKALILEGKGRNGKSTFINILRHVLGGENTTPLTLTQLNSEYSRQMLDGALANFAEETPTKAGDTTNFKNLTTGGGVQVRAPYKAPYTLHNRAKLLFACNELPESADTTDAYFRRFLIIPFRAQFNKTDEHFDAFIEEKMKKECPGIFNLCIDAYEKAYQRGALTEPKVSVQALKEYQDNIDPMAQWLEDRVELRPVGNGCDDRWVPLAKIFQEFSVFSDRNDLPKISSITFTRKLKQKISDFDARYVVKKERNSKGWNTARGLKATIFHADDMSA